MAGQDGGGTRDREASYFPSIEKTYGQPVQHWIGLIHTNTKLTRHGELVAWLKREHGLGHGHANALVAYALRRRP
jgi:hypothetical protein